MNFQTAKAEGAYHLPVLSERRSIVALTSSIGPTTCPTDTRAFLSLGLAVVCDVAAGSASGGIAGRVNRAVHDLVIPGHARNPAIEGRRDTLRLGPPPERPLARMSRCRDTIGTKLSNKKAERPCFQGCPAADAVR